MAQPKKKSSKSAKNMRRANWKLEQPTVVECPQCHSPKLPHFVCPTCGYYDGRQVINMEEKAAAQ